jgi:exopolyphosphatase/guanosine-5'-triphosphate,3'-diphosphate pyrophosphatase
MKSKKQNHNLLYIAVIEVGTTAITMTIVEADSLEKIKQIDFLKQSVSIGKDTFTKGYIEKATIEECVLVLKNFKRVLYEYGISQEEQIIAVATTAVRESANRDAFCDRIYIATGIKVRILDNMDIVRYTYISLKWYLDKNPYLLRNLNIVCEIGGGTTEILLLSKGSIISIHSFRIGSLRLRESLEQLNLSLKKQIVLLENEINHAITQIIKVIPPTKNKNLISVGRDMRFAAQILVTNYNPEILTRIPITRLEKLVREISLLSLDECVKKYKIPYQEAETLLPTLLFYCMLGKELKQKNIIASNISMSNGIVLSQIQKDSLNVDFKKQIIKSAWEIAKKYKVDEKHAQHVLNLCKTLFNYLKEEHKLNLWHELLLSVAAILHDTGMFISTRSHHKHSMYIILNSEIFGLSLDDIILISLIARYHRRASPKPTHEEYAKLEREAKLTVCKLAAILRVADALDRTHRQKISCFECKKEKDKFVIVASKVDDVSVEQLALQNKADMFEDIYGMSVVIEKKG